MAKNNLEGIAGADLQLFRMVREIRALGNRIDRYYVRLIAEGLKAAEEKGLYAIVLRKDDAEPVIGFAGEKLPSLHRKYVHARKKYSQRIDVLEDIYEKSG